MARRRRKVAASARGSLAVSGRAVAFSKPSTAVRALGYLSVTGLSRAVAGGVTPSVGGTYDAVDSYDSATAVYNGGA